MGIEAVYLICFIASILLLILIFERGEIYTTAQILFLLLFVLGNGGYFALANSSNLQEAILANKISYVIGIFEPMLILFIICDIFRIQIKKCIKLILFIIQVVLYMGVCSIGTHSIYYKSVEFHREGGVSYLTKTYGPMHTMYMITLISYMLAVIVVSAISVRRKTQISARNLDKIIIFEAASLIGYLFERFFKLKVEIMPIIGTIIICFMLYIVNRLRTFSIYDNTQLARKKLESICYIVFDKKLLFMGCNEMAMELFPELKNWELEKKIPGSGGRFNTYIRQKFVKYVDEAITDIDSEYTFAMKDKLYQCNLSTILSDRNRIQGYIIEIVDVSNVNLQRGIQ